MPGYIENYGFSETYVNNNNKITNNSIEWKGNYDGHDGYLNMNINDNGYNKFVSMSFDKDDLIGLLGTQTINMDLNKRLARDFLNKPYKKRKTNKKKTNKRKTRKRK